MLNFKDAQGGSRFKELAIFAITLLILPHSNADVERQFSSMNIIKSKQRNIMKLNLLSAILIIIMINHLYFSQHKQQIHSILLQFMIRRFECVCETDACDRYLYTCCTGHQALTYSEFDIWYIFMYAFLFLVPNI